MIGKKAPHHSFSSTNRSSKPRLS